MSYLLLSIICSTLIFVVFKLFDKYGVDNLQAIIVNYIIAFSVGSISEGFAVTPAEWVEKNWFENVLILGLLFISLFQIMALVSQKFGVSIVSVAVKMSLIIPVLFAVFHYNDSLGRFKIAGIILALLAVYMTTQKADQVYIEAKYTLLPILLFLGSGALDTYLKYNQEEIVPSHEHGSFASYIFLTAAFYGMINLGLRSIKKKFNYSWKNIVAGIALGIPNYGSIYFLIKSLEYKGLESSIVFPINNVGIVALSALIGALFFYEKLSLTNKAGIAMAIISIFLITFGNLT